MRTGVIIFFLFIGDLSSSAWCAPYTLLAGDKEFSIEVANTAEQHRLGLMHRHSLADNKGLLMIFERDSVVRIWMKNVNFPLDVVWLAANGRIVDLQTLAICQYMPCPIYRPSVLARYVLEVGAGKFPLNLGDKVEILNASGDSLHRAIHGRDNHPD